MRPTKGTSGYLLDTNVILYAAMAPEKLGKNTKRVLEESPRVFFSPISITELEVKSLKKKLPAALNLHQDLAEQDFAERPFTAKHATAIRSFPSLIIHDPYDRMLLAQASEENLTLITSDQVLLALNFPWVLDAAS